MIKRIFFAILILVIVALLFRGPLYRQFVTYKSVGQRTNYIATDDKLVKYIEQKVENKKDLDINDITQLTLSITSEQLNFTASNNDTDPNKLIYSNTAHCIGYASFFSTTFNFILKKFNLEEVWIAKPQVGQLYFLGINVHPYLNTAFLKDHDFVIIENKTTGEILAVDPTISDYLCIGFVTFQK